MGIHINGHEQRIISKGQMALSSSENTTLTTSPDYYKIGGTWADGVSECFDVDAGGRLTFNGCCATNFLFTGVSDLKVNKACTLTYGLYLNGALVSGAETPHTFTSASKVESISITKIVTLQPGDYVEVHAKSSEDTTILTSETLSITFWGEQ